MVKVPVPFFPDAPKEYEQSYMSQIVRAFAIYARQLSTPQQLFSFTENASAASDGVLLWDTENNYPVVSRDDEWRQLVVAGGYAQFIRDSSVTAAAIDTAYSITYDAPAFSDGVSRDATHPERIVFADTGVYLLSFTAQLSSTSGSIVSFRFWPAINGTDVSGSTILNTLHQSGSKAVVSRSALFPVSAGDYLEVKWATSSLNGSLEAQGPTAYAPGEPSTTLTVVRIRE